jgi:hypothetical protein
MGSFHGHLIHHDRRPHGTRQGSARSLEILVCSVDLGGMAIGPDSVQVPALAKPAMSGLEVGALMRE